MIPATIALEKATLYIIATPIGNLGDMTIRAINTLHSVDIILAEDTRHSNRLLQHYGIHKSCYGALHQFNEPQQTEKIIHLLQEHKTVALISDAGTPLIADPGFHLVQAIHQANQQIAKQAAKQATKDAAIQPPQINISPVPGPCAFVAALSCAGIPADRFLFIGFLPPKSGTRQNSLRHLAEIPYSLICYEAPHRLLATLEDIYQILGDRQICIAKELTKIHENIVTQSVRSYLQHFQQQKEQQTIQQAMQETVKGEYVLLIAGWQKKPATLDAGQEKMLHILKQHCGSKKAAEILHAITGINKKICYQTIIDHADA